MPELLKPPADLGIAFAHCARVETSPRRTEATWNLLWDMKFQREIARVQLPNFTYTNQLPLVLRDAASTSSSANANTADPNNDDNEISEGTSSDGEEENFDIEDSPIKPRSRRLEPGDRAHYGRIPTSIQPLAFSLRSHISSTSSTSLGSLPVPAPLTPINPRSRPVGPPNTDQSIPARRGKDRTFLVDYALISLALDAEAKIPHKTLMGFKDVPAATGNAPALIELKKCISRAQATETQEAALRAKILDALGDIEDESSAALACYPSQESFVGISVTGPWWSFSLVRRSGSAAVRTHPSQVFVLGSKSHDKLLSTIIDAAAKSPADPLAYENGILEHYLERFKIKEPPSCLAPLDVDLAL